MFAMFTIFSAIFGIVFVFVVISIIVSVVKHHKFSSNVEKTAEAVMLKAQENITKKEEEEKPRFCDYCGTKMAKGENKCSSCGAKLQK